MLWSYWKSSHDKNPKQPWPECNSVNVHATKWMCFSVMSNLTKKLLLCRVSRVVSVACFTATHTHTHNRPQMYIWLICTNAQTSILSSHEMLTWFTGPAIKKCSADSQVPSFLKDDQGRISNLTNYFPILDNQRLEKGLTYLLKPV